MSSGVVLRGDLPVADAQRVVLRAQPAAAPAEQQPPGMWITEQELSDLKRRWIGEGREQGQRDTQSAAQQKADADAKTWLDRELKTRDEKHAKDQADKWRSLAAALALQMQSLREQLEEQVADWTFMATTRLLGQQTREDVVATVKQLLADSQLEGPVNVLLHPQELAFIDAAAGWPADVTFAASDRVALGGCLLQTNVQTLDARLETQLGLLRAALNQARHEPRGEE